MKLSEKEFKQKVAELYNGEIVVVGKYKGLSFPIICSDKYGIFKIQKAFLLLKYKPTIKIAMNKTEYFMNMLKYKQPNIYDSLEPMSEYITAKQKMLFKNRFGIVAVTPDNLIHGHVPNIKSAINRKEYFKNQLLFIYGDKYEFEITSTSRHFGTVTLICKKHGRQYVDSDSIFLGSGCPCCNKNWEKSTTFYLVNLFSEEENFYKLGISHYDKNGNIRRFNEYKNLGYNINVIYTHTFDDYIQCKEFELKLKRLIKHNLYVPKKWPNEASTEAFTNELLPLIKQNLIYDIVSTSGESQRSTQSNELCQRNCSMIS